MRRIHITQILDYHRLSIWIVWIMRLSIIDFNYQIIDYRLSIQSIIDYQIWTMRLSIVDYRLSIIDYQLNQIIWTMRLSILIFQIIDLPIIIDYL